MHPAILHTEHVLVSQAWIKWILFRQSKQKRLTEKQLLEDLTASGNFFLELVEKGTATSPELQLSWATFFKGATH